MGGVGESRLTPSFKITGSLLVVSVLLLTALLQDRGKTHSLHPLLRDFQLLLGEWRLRHSPRLIACSDLDQMASSARFLAAGWTKAVYSADHDVHGPVAIKVVNMDGRHMQDCSDGPQQCHAGAAEKLLKEIRLLEKLRHPQVIKLLGYCIPTDPFQVPTEELGGRLALVTELGEPTDLIRLLQLNWEQRLQVLHSLSHLLDFLATANGEQSVGIGDFRSQQFVMAPDNRHVIQIVDVDDFRLEEPECLNDTDCAFGLCMDQKCISGNEKKNLETAHRLFFRNLLPHGAPNSLRPDIDQLLDDLGTGTISAAVVKSALDRMAKEYGAGLHRDKYHWSRNETFSVEANRDLPGFGDYQCGGSENHVGCSLSVADEAEARSLCASQSVCRAFVWTKRRSWTGRHVVQFKNAVSSPSFNQETLLYIRLSS